MLDREQLETLSTIVELGSFERAAAVLHVSRGAISQRVRALEEKLKTVLLVREKPVTATPKGEVLLRHVKALRLLEEDAVNTLRPTSKRRLPARIAIAVNGDSIATWFGPVIWGLLHAERIALEVITDDHNHTFQRLRRGDVMGCVSSEATPLRNFEATPLGALTYRCVATPGFVQKHFEKGLSVQAVAAAPAILFDRKDSLHDRFLEMLFGVKFTHYFCHFIPSPVSRLDAILAGVGYGLVPRHQTEALLAGRRLMDISPDCALAVPLYWHHWKRELPVAHQVTQAVTEHARQVLDP